MRRFPKLAQLSDIESAMRRLPNVLWELSKNQTGPGAKILVQFQQVFARHIFSNVPREVPNQLCLFCSSEDTRLHYRPSRYIDESMHTNVQCTDCNETSYYWRKLVPNEVTQFCIVTENQRPRAIGIVQEICFAPWKLPDLVQIILEYADDFIGTFTFDNLVYSDTGKRQVAELFQTIEDQRKYFITRGASEWISRCWYDSTHFILVIPIRITAYPDNFEHCFSRFDLAGFWRTTKGKNLIHRQFPAFFTEIQTSNRFCFWKLPV